jgi:hypothetical protein
VAHDVAGFHTRNKRIVEVQVGAADRGARDLDDGIARMLDPRVRDTVAANILFAVPAQSPHQHFSFGIAERLAAP